MIEQLDKTTATEDKILKDYIAYSNGKLIVGTMPNNGAVKIELNAGETYTIPEGYHNGNGTVVAMASGVDSSLIDYQKVTRSGNTFDLTGIPNYQELTLFENLFPVATKIYTQTHSSSVVSYPNEYAYDASTGTLTLSGTTGTSTKQQITELTCYYFTDTNVKYEVKSFAASNSGDTFSLTEITNYENLKLFENLFPVANYIYSAIHTTSNVEYPRYYCYDRQTGELIQLGEKDTTTVQRITSMTCYYFNEE